jgi:hypothetical protein
VFLLAPVAREIARIVMPSHRRVRMILPLTNK